ncbi:uncharacterized protein [Diabrotica undecimpunctata]|uniref:uncharacterized protein n=1 Tax=Diabrotica undecimpunctata TaxID=50387 RepID=UPI003B63E0DC
MCIAIFFDIKKAFNTCFRFNIIKKLHASNIRGHCLACIENLLKDFSFQVRVNNVYSDFYTAENGTSQGSVLSSTLFLVAINNILNKLHKPLKARLYADDLVVYIKGAQKESNAWS